METDFAFCEAYGAWPLHLAASGERHRIVDASATIDAVGRYRLAKTGRSQADAYAGFNRLYDSGRVHEAACWAHMRRKFFDIQQAHASPLAGEAIEHIAELYTIESEIRGRSPDERKQMRNTSSRPLIVAFHRWMQNTLKKASRKSDIAAAIGYALGRWPALLRYCDDGLLEIDNNTAERALGAVALGRKNLLVCRIGCR